MANKFRKAEKNSSNNNSLIVILAISLFILMISGAAAIMNKETVKTENKEKEVVENYNGDSPSLDVNSNQQIEVENNENSSVNNNVEENNQDANKVEEEPKAKVFNFPCETDILCEFSGNTPVFSEVLQDWRTHPAIDYAAETQFDVKAISDGTVEDIYTDGLMGVTILIDHGNELKSVYQSLDENINVKENDQITAGTVIGKAGTTAVTEKYDGKYLLHFAVIDNGEYKDPALYISQ